MKSESYNCPEKGLGEDSSGLVLSDVLFALGSGGSQTVQVLLLWCTISSLCFPAPCKFFLNVFALMLLVVFTL